MKKSTNRLLLFILGSFTSIYLHAQSPLPDSTVMRDGAGIYLSSANNTITVVSYINVNSGLTTLKHKMQYDSVKFFKTTSTGKILWEKRYGFNNGGSIDFIDTTGNKGYILAMNYDNVNAFVELDSSGNITYSKSYPNPAYNISITKIRKLPDGNYIYGSIEKNYSKSDTVTVEIFYRVNVEYYNIHYNLGKIDNAGNVLWQKVMDSTYEGIPVNDLLFGTSYSELVKKIELDYTPSDDLIHYLYKGRDTINNKCNLILKKSDLNGNLVFSKLIRRDSVYHPAPYIAFYDYHDFTKLGNEYLFRIDSSSIKRVYISDLDGNITSYIDPSAADDSMMYTSKNRQYCSYLHKDNDDHYYFLRYNQSEHPSIISKCSRTQLLWSYSPPVTMSIYDGEEMMYPFLLQGSGNKIIIPNNNYYVTRDSIGHFLQTQYYLHYAYLDGDANTALVTVYTDYNNNGQRDSTEKIFTNALLQATSGATVSELPLMYNSAGYVTVFTDSGMVLKLISHDQQIKFYDIFPPIKTMMHNTATAFIDTIVFKLTPKPGIQDLQIQIVPGSNVRPGVLADYKLIAKNVGTVTASNISVKFLIDSLQNFSSSSLPVTVFYDTITWRIDSLQPLQSIVNVVLVRNEIPPMLNMNDTVSLYAEINPFENDSFIPDNKFELHQVVVSSFDPNNKTEAHGAGISPAQLASGEYLYYTIQFQNTGNAAATRIKVTDSLSDKFDWSSLEILSNSHLLDFKVENKNMLVWWNDNTYLPDSTHDEPNSHGYISFRIKPAASFSPTDSIKNKAFIYFDYNLPVITNTATTRILQERITGLIQKEIKTIHLFPSPTSGNVTMNIIASSNKTAEIRIMDINGSEIYHQPLQVVEGLNTIDLNMQQFANGIYIISLNTKEGELYMGKIIKQ